jgi:hypothetical protein
MRTWLLAASFVLATPAFADDKPKAEKPAPAAATKPAACKKKVVGKGLDRKVVCVFEDDIVVGAKAPKPAVVIAPADGRRVVGRPKQTDPLTGLRQRRRTD